MEVGVAGIVVSNHGARQLDYSPATITVLEEVNICFFGLWMLLSRRAKIQL